MMTHRSLLPCRRRACPGRLRAAAVLAWALLAVPVPGLAQDFNIALPVADIESRLRTGTFDIVDWRGSRAPGDRTSRVALQFPDEVLLVAKWATAPTSASEFNNEPRFEMAAYEIQKLFLDEPELAVPPTVVRAFPLAYVRERIPDATATFREAPRSALVALQYWLMGVTPENFWDSRRARSDTVYARHIGNFNILTHLIRHHDANVGNFLISENPENPRVFAVDNGVAFSAPVSNRGHMWRDLQVRQLPRHTVERLRLITREDLDRVLGVMAEWEIHDGTLVPVPPGENMSPGRGVRRSSQRIQLGLTSQEINGVENRIRQLLRRADEGRIETF
jgi:hypothetical protein